MSYCKDKSRKIETLLVWKIDRFARNVEDHYAVKATLRKLGVQIASVTEPIQSDPNGKLMETILAGFAQFDNDIRALRTVQGMRQRLREGIWPWRPPLGYLPPGHGKKTEPDRSDPARFSPIQKAWRLFATGVYTKAAILRLLQRWGVYACRGDSISPQLLDDIFKNPYYAGVLHDPWTGDEHPGRHTPMVSAAEFAQVQAIVRSRRRDQPHHRIRDDFPLRGHVRCPSCEALMTGYFAQGRSKPYPYYRCFQHSCPTRTISYSASLVHDEFSGFLAETSVPHYLAVGIVAEVASARWDQAEQTRKAAVNKREDAEGLKRQLQELISMRTAKLVTDDEFTAQRDQLKRRLSVIQASSGTNDVSSLTEAEVETLAGTLSGLEATWRLGTLEAKRGFGELLFPAGYVFQRVRTAETGLLFRTIGASQGSLSDVAALARENANALKDEIFRLLVILRMGSESENKAA